MLVVSEKRYLPVMINTLVLFKDDMYFYIHRDVYDQAVVLSDRYETLDELVEVLGRSPVNHETVLWFYAKAPRPIHILAPYLSLIDGPIEQNMEQCCGVLHVITSMIHVRNFMLKPVEIRKSVSFSLTIKEEYEMAWDRFFQSAVPYEQRQGHVFAGPIRPPAADSYPRAAWPAAFDADATVPLIPGSPAEQDDGPAEATGPTSTEAEKNATRKLLEF